MHYEPFLLTPAELLCQPRKTMGYVYIPADGFILVAVVVADGA